MIRSKRFQKALVESYQDPTRCCQHLNFGLNWTQGVKAKRCRALSPNFLASVQYKIDTEQNMIFSVALLNGLKNSNFFTLPNLDKIQLQAFLNPLDFTTPPFWYFLAPNPALVRICNPCVLISTELIRLDRIIELSVAISIHYVRLFYLHYFSVTSKCITLGKDLKYLVT